MPNHRTSTSPLRHRLAVALLSCTAGPAFALGLASQVPSAVLGSPLDVSIAIRLDAGESLEPRCVRAQVQVGERRLAAEALRTSLSGLGAGGAGPATVTFRVMSLVRIQEPIVELLVEAGCQTSLSRRYVIFADPPAVVPPGPAVAATTSQVGVGASAVASATPGSATKRPGRRCLGHRDRRRRVRLRRGHRQDLQPLQTESARARRRAARPGPRHRAPRQSRACDSIRRRPSRRSPPLTLRRRQTPLAWC